MTKKISNRRKADEGPDFYPTPDWGTEALLKYEDFYETILEPCCGDGAMSEVLKRHGHIVKSSDIHDRGYGEVKDFFSITEKQDNIITNPPYGIANDIVEHALSITKYKVAMLVRIAFLEGLKRYERFYSSNPPARIWVFSERLSMYPKNHKDSGGDGGTTCYAWFVWDRDEEAAMFGTKIGWIAPGLKPKKPRKTKRIIV